MSEDDFVDDLIHQAEAYAQKYLSITNQQDDASDQSGNLPPLSLDIPSKHLTTLTSILEGDTMEVKTTEKGKGFYAKRDIQIGERLVVAKPVTLVMACELDEQDDESLNDDDESTDSNNNPSSTAKGNNNKTDKAAADDDDESVDSNSDPLSRATGTKRNGLILLHTLHAIIENKSVWIDTLSHLFPRTLDEVLALPPWICSDASIGMEIDALMEGLPELLDEVIANEIQTRLALIVRYNVLSAETSSEMFVYPDADNGGMINLEATALYGPEVSFFNHGHAPNVSRYCIGDIIFFVANQHVPKGQELCFSYIEHEFLCENAERRTALLEMDFKDSGNEQPKSKRQRTAQISMPLIDIEMQNELMATVPTDRLDIIKDMLNPDRPLNPSGDDYQSDRWNLEILNAITLENLGRSRDALEQWNKCLQFCKANHPPIDETTIAIHVRIAFCATSCKKVAVAEHHAAEALRMHGLLFGGGVRRFRDRYCHEFRVMGGLDENDNRVIAQMLWPTLVELN